MPSRGATSQTITRVVIAVMLSATLVAQQSAPATSPTPPPTPAYAETWAVPVEISERLLLSVGQHAVFLAHADGIAAHAKADGKVLWNHPRAGITHLLASQSPETPVAAIVANDLIALDPASGELRWTATLAEPADHTYLEALKGGGLTVASGKSVRAYRRDGAVAWSTALPAAATTPAVEHDGVAWLGTAAPSIVRIDISSGNILSQVPVASPPQAIATAPGEAYVVSAAPVLARYRTGETKPSWQWKPKRGVAEVVGAPVVGADFVFVTALDNTLQAFDRGGGAVRWRQPLPSRPAAGLSEVNGLLVVPLITGAIVRLSPINGTTQAFGEMKLEPDARLQAFQMDPDGAIFTVTVSSRILALTAWRRSTPAKLPQRP